MKKENKKANIFYKYFYPIQPFLLGALVVMVLTTAYMQGAIVNTISALVLGGLIAGYFYQKKIDRLTDFIDFIEKMNKKSFEAVTKLLSDLQEHAGIDVEMTTNDEDLEELATSVRMKGGDKGGKKTVN